jgi:hypothetical protein
MLLSLTRLVVSIHQTSSNLPSQCSANIAYTTGSVGGINGLRTTSLRTQFLPRREGRFDVLKWPVQNVRHSRAGWPLEALSKWYGITSGASFSAPTPRLHADDSNRPEYFVLANPRRRLGDIGQRDAALGTADFHGRTLTLTRLYPGVCSKEVVARVQ